MTTPDPVTGLGYGPLGQFPLGGGEQLLRGFGYDPFGTSPFGGSEAQVILTVAPPLLGMPGQPHTPEVRNATAGFGFDPFGTSPFGGVPGGFGYDPFGTSPFGGSDALAHPSPTPVSSTPALHAPRADLRTTTEIPYEVVRLNANGQWVLQESVRWTGVGWEVVEPMVAA